MALSTYAQLKSAVADWLERSDLADRTADFVTLAESRLNRLLRFRTLESDQALSGAIGSRLIPLPAGFREPVALWFEGTSGREAMRYVDVAGLAAGLSRGRPRLWTIDGGSVAFERPCDDTYAFSLRMLGRLALSDAQPSNAILADYPDLYLFGALVEAAPYLRDADLLSLFAARFEAALAEARAKEARGRSLATLGVEPGLAMACSLDIRG
jgi:hypothetical protein